MLPLHDCRPGEQARRRRYVAIAGRVRVLGRAKAAWCLTCAIALSQLGVNQRASCTITRVSDGDSVTCKPYGRVRLLSIDAPELSDGELGRKARAELLAIVPVGTKVMAETDVQVKDQYGRVLAYLFLPGVGMVNERMAEIGYATALVYSPNVKYASRIRAAAARARRAKRGFWGTGAFECTPRDYRAGRCRFTN